MSSSQGSPSRTSSTVAEGRGATGGPSLIAAGGSTSLGWREVDFGIAGKVALVPAYNAAKAAEISLAKSLAREYARTGVTVNAVAPGSVLWEGGGWDRRQKADPEGIADFVRHEMPMGRFGTVEEVADVVAFLCSRQASLVTGACIAVDGGQGRSNI